MKRQSAVIFPDTVPSEHVCIPLVQVFDPLVYCQPVENDQDGQEMSTLCRDLALLDFIAPAPLGVDRERFLRLISDIRTRKDDYAAQLGHLSLASIPTGVRKEKETKSSIVENLLSSHGIKDGKSEKKNMLLWQARLVLKLAEQYDEDQHQLKQEINKITGREKGLFRELRSKSDTSFSQTGRQLSSSMAGNTQVRLRLKAWARIFSLGNYDADMSCCFITSSTDALDLLAEENERKTGSRPQKIIDCLLPASCSETKSLSDYQRQFREEGRELLEQLASIVDSPSPPSKEESVLFREDDSQWGILLEKIFPVRDWGRCRLSLYDFSSVPVRQLFLDAFGYDDDVLQSEPILSKDKGPIIGLLEPV